MVRGAEALTASLIPCRVWLREMTIHRLHVQEELDTVASRLVILASKQRTGI